MQKLKQEKLTNSKKIMRSDQSPSIHHSADAMPLITSATPSTLEPQASSHGESGIPIPSPSVTRNEASETGVNHYSSLHSRSDEHTERKMSPMEDMVLHLRSWYNYCCYSDMSEVQKRVQSYCGSVWTDFSTLIGLRSCTSSTAAH